MKVFTIHYETEYVEVTTDPVCRFAGPCLPLLEVIKLNAGLLGYKVSDENSVVLQDLHTGLLRELPDDEMPIAGMTYRIRH